MVRKLPCYVTAWLLINQAWSTPGLHRMNLCATVQYETAAEAGRIRCDVVQRKFVAPHLRYPLSFSLAVTLLFGRNSVSTKPCKPFPRRRSTPGSRSRKIFHHRISPWGK